MKPIRVSDPHYSLIEGDAKREKRSIQRQLEVILDGYYGTPSENTPSPKNTNVKILEDGTVTKADPNNPEFAYNPPLVDARKIISEAKASPSVSDLFAEEVKHIPDVTVLEQACCLNENVPCKHWQWDTATGEGYKNILSGRFMEVE